MVFCFCRHCYTLLLLLSLSTPAGHLHPSRCSHSRHGTQKDATHDIIDKLQLFRKLLYQDSHHTHAHAHAHTQVETKRIQKELVIRGPTPCILAAHTLALPFIHDYYTLIVSRSLMLTLFLAVGNIQLFSVISGLRSTCGYGLGEEPRKWNWKGSCFCPRIIR
ncbi:hypothetical protein B0H63DRAFT_139153 [Podospora didyma]|uniref:Secreted protein n=1 Tax=Podospora didyma TaxID=330526 RepID=A0AAE0NRZ9_9PEZI|nr:hypothetical protein B0H63DRAFT_139153 [Podospora didyma]